MRNNCNKRATINHSFSHRSATGREGDYILKGVYPNAVFFRLKPEKFQNCEKIVQKEASRAGYICPFGEPQ
ncbi:hypothetical protein EEL33_00020 [Muribaculaceae bacterium Isolate-037 (Harlan)]|nr:hypothetical protein EEL33_00020 [Muribaculaceae bacterium Isolate-037 (Harlan)]